MRFWVWEFPQSLVGVLGVFVLIVGHKIIDIGVVENVLVVRCSGRWGALSLGQIIIGDECIQLDPSNQLFRHEYGHSLQSQKAGILYLFRYGLPSLFSAMSSNNKHYCSAVEKDANKLAHDFFQEKFAHHCWDHDRFPLV